MAKGIGYQGEPDIEREMAKTREYFSSRWGLVLTALGMAVGTGNVWRFPRVAAANGGGAFLIAWLLFMMTWSVPLVIAEFVIGKRARQGPAGALGQLIGKKYNWMGAFVGLCTCFIMFYYSVVTGWCLKYVLLSATTGFPEDPETFWKAFTRTGHWEPILFHLLAMMAACGIVSRGIVSGIERTNRILIPLLFLLLIGAALRAVTLPGAVTGLNYLFTPDWRQLAHYRIWLEALSQSAWSVGAGWGLILTYAVYMREREDVVLSSFTVGFGDYAASLLAGIAVICTVFAVLPQTEALRALGAGNQGLTFIWIPRLFSRIPAGRFFLSVFFLALSFAAISSLIAMVELAARMLIDLGMTRRRAVPLVGLIGFSLGLPSAYSLRIFDNQDWVWGLGLTVSGFFIAFAVIKFGAGRFRRELINTPYEPYPVGRWYEFVMARLIPLEFAALITWWFYQAITIYDPEGWWNPFHAFSVGTCLLQWGILIVVLMMVNRQWAHRVFELAEA